MIELTSLVDQKFYLNLKLIQKMVATPDTVITLVDGKTFVVKESTKQVVALIIAFEQKIHQKIQEE